MERRRWLGDNIRARPLPKCQSGRGAELCRLWREICEQERKAQSRNRELLQDFQRLETHVAILSARTEDLRKHKHAAIATSEYLNTPRWKDTCFGRKNSESYSSTLTTNIRNKAVKDEKSASSSITHTSACHQTLEDNSQRPTEPAPVPERNAEDDSEQEDIKETKEKEEAEFNLISSGSPTRERKSWLQRFGCLTSCLFPGKCRKRAALRRSSQDSLHTLPELHPVETTLELAAVADYQSQKSMQGDERCSSGSPPQKSYLQDKMESGIPVGTKDFIEGSEASSTESEDVTEKGRSLEKEDFDGFYD